VDDETFVFASFRLIPAQRMLLEDGRPLRLGSRALDILITLVEHAGGDDLQGSADRQHLARYCRR
jgi:DNA-binding winged helix-turn-helix (wHTH) protein